jgi:hypothetical protein
MPPLARHWLLALALLPGLGLSQAAAQSTTVPHTCTQAISLTQGGVGTSGLIGPAATIPSSMPTGGPAATNLTSGNSILVCGYIINMAAAGTAGLEYGTKTTNPCDTGTVPLTPTWSMGTTSFMTDGGSFFRGLSVPPGNTLCLVSATSAASIVVYYDNLPP